MQNIVKITRKVEKRQFNRRGCPICKKLLSIESFNGRINGRFGPSMRKMASCSNCAISLIYLWNYNENIYILDQLRYFPHDYISFVISVDYKIKNADNVLFESWGGEGVYRTPIARTILMPSKKMLKFFDAKLDLYAVFS